MLYMTITMITKHNKDIKHYYKLIIYIIITVISLYNIEKNIKGSRTMIL